MPEGVNAKVEVLFAQSLSAFAVVHLNFGTLQGEINVRIRQTIALQTNVFKSCRIHRLRKPVFFIGCVSL
jgi:hypothetical protein